VSLYKEGVGVWQAEASRSSRGSEGSREMEPFVVSALTLVAAVALNLLYGAVETKLKQWYQFAFVGVTRSVQRVKWPEGKLLLERSRAILDQYEEVVTRDPCGLKEDQLRDTFDELRDWVREDATTQWTEEIYLVHQRRRRIPAQIDGVLYATFYKTWRPRGSTKRQDPEKQNRVMVWYLLTDERASGRARDVARELWCELKSVVRETMLEEAPDERVDYYLQAIGPEQGKDANDSDRRLQHRRTNWDVLSHLGAKTVLTRFIVPDTSCWDPENQYDGVLLYQGYREPTGSVPAIELVDFVYGTAYLWDFQYPYEIQTLGELESVVRYFTALTEDVSRSLVADAGRRIRLEDVAIPLVPIDDRRAMELGLR
jgi:hypothetical protein